MEMALAPLRQLVDPAAALGSSVVNLKQFPRAEHPEGWAPPKAAYQALIRSRMTLAQFRSGGLLGETALLLGDPSGGFRVRLSRRAAGRILDALGLEIAAEERWADEDAAVLEPVFPFWMDLDLRYEESETICWRRPDWCCGQPGESAPDRSWTDESGEQPREIAPKEKDPCVYNVSRRSAIEEITGRLSFPNTTLRVFPLFAPKHVGDEDVFCASALGDGHCYRRWGDFVYLIASNSEQVADRDTGEISRWAHRKLAFAVPVQRRDPASRSLEWSDPRSKILEWGLVEPIVFVDSDLEAIRGREINGIPVARASLESPPSVWMDEFQQKVTHSSRLVLDTDLPSAIGPGEQVERRRLLEIFRGRHPTAGRPGIATEELEREVTLGFSMMESPELSFLSFLMLGGEEGEKEAKTAKADKLLGMAAAIRGTWQGVLGGDTLGGDANRNMQKRVETAARQGLTINQYSLKQFRDAEDPSSACYRSRVRQRIRLVPAQRATEPGAGPSGLIEEFKEQEADAGSAAEPLWLALHSYPVQAITRQLGLQPSWTDDSGDRIVNYFRPMPWSFWMKCTLDFEEAHEGEHWETPPPEGAHWETLPPADPELAKLLNSEHNIVDPLQVIKMLLDAKSAVGPGSIKQEKVGGSGRLTTPSVEDTLSEIGIRLMKSGSMQMALTGKSGSYSLSGKWIAIHSVIALVIEKVDGRKTTTSFGIYVKDGSIAVTGDELQLMFDPA